MKWGWLGLLGFVLFVFSGKLSADPVLSSNLNLLSCARKIAPTIDPGHYYFFEPMPGHMVMRSRVEDDINVYLFNSLGAYRSQLGENVKHTVGTVFAYQTVLRIPIDETGKEKTFRARYVFDMENGKTSREMGWMMVSEDVPLWDLEPIEKSLNQKLTVFDFQEDKDPNHWFRLEASLEDHIRRAAFGERSSQKNSSRSLSKEEVSKSYKAYSSCLPMAPIYSNLQTLIKSEVELMGRRLSLPRPKRQISSQIN